MMIYMYVHVIKVDGDLSVYIFINLYYFSIFESLYMYINPLDIPLEKTSLKFFIHYYIRLLYYI